MGKMNDYSLLKAEIKMEVEIENLEKLIEAKEETKALAQKMQEVLNEIQMGVSQIEHGISTRTDSNAELLTMLKDLNSWIEEGLGAVK
jgi:predicted nuclease with TOPRIM domain